MVKLPIFGQLTFEKIMPFIIGAVFLIVVVIVLNKIIKNIFFQAAYLETLKGFAKEHGYKKPMSKWVFIFIEIAGIFFALFFAVSFFKNALATVGILFLLLLISVFLAVKYYTPPFKAFSIAENLTYNGDVIFGKYKGRDILMKIEKETVDFHQESLLERQRKIAFIKRIVSVSFALNNGKINSIKYEKGKIRVDPEALKPDFSYTEKMLGDIPVADNVQLFITKINGHDYVTLEKINSNILFTVELYYICEAVNKIMDLIK